MTINETSLDEEFINRSDRESHDRQWEDLNFAEGLRFEGNSYTVAGVTSNFL
uniref:Uncharacterized protein n=1 Tax=Anguilla anguilla TaxID=7936 RepID=A0A0E9WP60_ANGAN